MRKSMKAILPLLIALSLILGLAGCQSVSPQTSDDNLSSATATPKESAGTVTNNEQPIELTFYFPTQTSGPLAITMEEIVAAFNDMQDNIQVNAVFTGNYSDTIQKTLTSFSGGNPPHVILTSGGNLPGLINENVVMDLKALIDQEDDALMDDYVQNFWTMFTYGEKIYGVPFQHSAPIMYYNKDIFTQAGLDPNTPPKTWSELEAAADKIAAAGLDVTPYEFMGDDWITQAMACSNGGNIYVDEKTVTLNSDATVEAVEFWQRLLQKGAAIENPSYGGVAENFIAEGTAIMFNSTGSMGNVIANATFDWDVSNIPANDGCEPFSPLGGGGFAIINRDSEQEIAASWEFVKYMTSPEVTAKWSITSGYFAMRYSAYELPEMKAFFAKNPQFSRTEDFLPMLVKPYLTTRQPEVAEAFNIALDDALINNQNAKAALDSAQEIAQALLDDSAE